MLDIETKQRNKNIFQNIINTLVILLVLGVIGGIIWSVIPGWTDYYAALPDRVQELDDAIELQMGDVAETPEMFQVGYDSPDIDIVFNTSNPETELSASNLYAQSLGSIVYVNALSEYGFISFGSGFVIGSNGIVVTNYHVIEGGSKIAITFDNETTYPVVDVLALSKEKDIAILKIDAENLPALPIGDSDNVNIGDTTYAIGHPENFLFTLSEGIVSAKREYIASGEGSQIQVTNAMSAGSSGGALLNDQGELIGITSSVMEYESNIVDVQNINFVIPINTIFEI